MSCVNALSEEFEVEIWRPEKPGDPSHTYEQSYSKGTPTSTLQKTGTSKRRGTKVHFLPDKSIFTVVEFNYDTLAQRLRRDGSSSTRASGDHNSPTSALPTPRPARLAAPNLNMPAASPSL